MATSCGIHIDRRSFHVVALEGSPRKHRIVAQHSGFITDDDDLIGEVSGALREVAKAHKLRAENVGLAVESGLAAFRTLTLPFDDHSKIEEVLKFEIENDLPQWDIDEVNVDFIVVDSKPGVESHLLVTALPKESLAPLIAATERGGLEANEAELDGTALFNAAYESGVLAEEAAQILVHVGDSSTTVVVVDSERLVSLRAIRAGALPAGMPVAGEEEEEGQEGAEPDLAAEAQQIEQTTQRIRRELGRTVSAAQTRNPVEAIYICGHHLPGLTEEPIFDVPIMPLEVLPPEDTGEPAPQELAVAYGAALRELGGGLLKPHLRREDLRYTGKFERLELPLAVFSLLLFTLLAVQLIVVNKEIAWRDEGNLAKGLQGDLQIWLVSSNAHMLPDPETGYPGRIQNPPQPLLDYVKRAESGGDDLRTKYQEIVEVNNIIVREIDQLEKQLGHVSNIPQPRSALEAASLVLGVLEAQGEDMGRFAIRSMSADYAPARSNSEDSAVVKLDMDFFGEDNLAATRHYSDFVNALEAAPWCLEYERKPTKVLDDGTGIFVEGMTIHVDSSKAIEEDSA